MKKTTLASLASSLVLLVSALASGMATALPAPTISPQIANGNYVFLLHNSTSHDSGLCIVSHGYGRNNQLTIARSGCATITVSNDGNRGLKFFTIHGHCVVKGAGQSNRIGLANSSHGCSASNANGVWSQTHSNYARFLNHGPNGKLLAAKYDTAGSVVVSASGDFHNWVLKHPTSVGGN